MNKPVDPASQTNYWRNWLSFAGAVVATGSFFAFLLLFAIELFSRTGNPYMGILAYIIAPGFLFLGLGMVALGAWIQRRQSRKSGEFKATVLAVDLSRPGDRRRLFYFVAASVVFLLCTAIGSYQSYHVSESVQFCGQACHGPMKPEFTAYQASSHARVSCVECHVGEGADAFVKAKMNGVHQLIGVMTGKYKSPHQNADPQPPSCPGNVRRMPLASEIRRQYRPHLSLVSG